MAEDHSDDDFDIIDESDLPMEKEKVSKEEKNY
jgi:hypothetical protein